MPEKKKKGVVPRLRFPEFRDAGPWEVGRLVDVAEVSMGTSPPSPAYNEDGDGLPLLQGNADMQNRRSAPRVYTREITKQCHIGDILISVRAPVGEVGKSIHNACIGRGLAAIRAKRSKCDQEYLYQWLLANESKWQHVSQGGTFDSITGATLKRHPVIAPSLLEQQKIAACLSSLDELIAIQAQKLEALNTHKKGLMQQLFPQEIPA